MCLSVSFFNGPAFVVSYLNLSFQTPNNVIIIRIKVKTIYTLILYTYSILYTSNNYGYLCSSVPRPYLKTVAIGDRVANNKSLATSHILVPHSVELNLTGCVQNV